jgi:hypothetical protein
VHASAPAQPPPHPVTTSFVEEEEEDAVPGPTMAPPLSAGTHGIVDEHEMVEVQGMLDICNPSGDTGMHSFATTLLGQALVCSEDSKSSSGRKLSQFGGEEAILHALLPRDKDHHHCSWPPAQARVDCANEHSLFSAALQSFRQLPAHPSAFPR